MTRPIIPVDARTPDWPRKVAGQINGHGVELAALATATNWAALADYADDAAAAAGGVAIGKLYRTGSAVKVRVA